MTMLHVAMHDSLYARAIVAANEKGEKAALLTVDICYIPGKQ